MTAVSFPPAPTYADVFLIQQREGQQPLLRFNPLWQRWFLDMAQVISSAGGGGGSIDHELLSGLLGGAANDHYHLTLERVTWPQIRNQIDASETMTVDEDYQVLSAGMIIDGELIIDGEFVVL